MISTKRELDFYIKADRIMNGLSPNRTHVEILIGLFQGGGISEYLRYMRCYDYYTNQKGIRNLVVKKIYGFLFSRLGVKLGFSIAPTVFGYGLLIPHYGTIVVGSNNKIGCFAVLHTSTCIASVGSSIGDGLYLATGAKITKNVILGDAVSIGANSVVNKSQEKGYALIAGSPGKVIKDEMPWWVRDGKKYYDRYKKVEELKRNYYK